MRGEKVAAFAAIGCTLVDSLRINTFSLSSLYQSSYLHQSQSTLGRDVILSFGGANTPYMKTSTLDYTLPPYTTVGNIANLSRNEVIEIVRLQRVPLEGVQPRILTAPP